MKKGDFWLGLETIASGNGVMADWEWGFGSAVGLVTPYLKPTDKQAEYFPCTAVPWCCCKHEVREIDIGFVAVCLCGDGECESFMVEPKDLLIYGFDATGFGERLRPALGFSAANGSAYAARGLQEIGVYEAVAAPVYFSTARSDMLLREMQKLVGFREGSFLVLTPTGSSWSPEVETFARACGGAHISLSSVLNVEPGEVFKSKGNIEPMLAEFARRVASGRNHGAMLSGIHREIASVKQEFGELRNAKQRLEKMLADGMFAFTRKVDATSFKVLCTILAEGDVSKAGRRLGISDPRMRYTLRLWAERGGAYRTMLDLVRWRKKMGRMQELPLNESVLHEKAESVDYPGLLSDVLEGLLSMTRENWQEKCEDLAELVRAGVQ